MCLSKHGETRAPKFRHPSKCPLGCPSGSDRRWLLAEVFRRYFISTRAEVVRSESSLLNHSTNHPWDSFFAEPSEQSVFHAAFLLSKIRAAEVRVDQNLYFMISS